MCHFNAVPCFNEPLLDQGRYCNASYIGCHRPLAPWPTFPAWPCSTSVLAATTVILTTHAEALPADLTRNRSIQKLPDVCVLPRIARAQMRNTYTTIVHSNTYPTTVLPAPHASQLTPNHTPAPFPIAPACTIFRASFPAGSHPVAWASDLAVCAYGSVIGVNRVAIHPYCCEPVTTDPPLNSFFESMLEGCR